MDILFTQAWWVVAVLILIAGLARGLAGFGFGLIVMPIGALMFPPAMLVPTITVIDVPAAILLMGSAWRKADGREVLPLIIAALVCLPLGIWLLLVVSAQALTLFVNVVALGVGIALLVGLKWRGQSSVWRTVFLGGLAGTLQSSVALPGPPIILGWVATDMPAAVLRANIIVFFFVIDLIAVPMLWAAGLIDAAVLTLTASLLPIYLGGVLAGRALFPYVSEVFFRRLVLALVILGAVGGLSVSLGNL